MMLDRMRTRGSPKRSTLASALLAASFLLGSTASAQTSPSGPRPVADAVAAPSDDVSALEGVGFDQKLDAQVPLGLTFRDEQGRERPLGEFFGERPVVLALVYYRCPMLCSQVLNGLVRSLRPLSIEVGDDLDVVTVSIDPEDTPERARLKKAAYVEEYGRPASEPYWHFLTGDPSNVRALAESVGFRYTYNATTNLYAHTAGIVILTPSGRVSRYLFGIDYPPRDLQFTVLESSAGKIGNPIRQVLLFCYNYDSATGKYTLSIVRVTQIFGVLTVLTLAGAVWAMLRWERRHRREAARAAESAASPS